MSWLVLAALTLLLGIAFAACWPLLGRLDNRRGDDDVLFDERPSLRDRLREWLGITDIQHHLERMECHMATITDALTALAEQVNAVSAAQATSFHNLQAAIDTLKSGELSADQQAAVDQIEKSLTTLADDATKADDGYEPTDPDQPTDDNPPVDNGDDTDVPVVKNAKR